MLKTPSQNCSRDQDRIKLERRNFLGRAAGMLTALGAAGTITPAIASSAANRREPLVWPALHHSADTQLLNGHTDTILDVVGTIGSAPSLVIFSEGNHLMVLHGHEIMGSVNSWAKSQPQYADLDFSNIIMVTLPQPIIVKMILTGVISFGNLALKTNRESGLFPDIVMAGAGPLRQLRDHGVIEPTARVFSKSRGLAMLVAKDNPLHVHDLHGAAKAGARLAIADDKVEFHARAKNRSIIEKLIGKQASGDLFSREIKTFPGRLGIAHRDIPYMVAEGYADVGITQYHLVSYFARTFPGRFEVISIHGAERFGGNIAFAKVINPLRKRATRAFESFFFHVARDVYPRYGFVPMPKEKYGNQISV